MGILNRKQFRRFEQDYFGNTPIGAMSNTYVQLLIRSMNVMSEALERINSYQNQDDSCEESKKALELVWGSSEN